MSTLAITAGDPLMAATPGRALAVAPLLYSDAERNTVACVWLEAVASVMALRTFDHEGDDDIRIPLGRAVAACLVIIAKCTTEADNVMPALVWQHRGPDCAMADLRGAGNRTAETAGKLAGLCRALILNDDRAGVRGGCIEAVRLCRETLYEPTYGQDLRAIAAYHGLSLRACFEAFTTTRMSKVAKNAKRYGKVA